MKSQAQVRRDRQTLDRVFPGEWALGLTIACKHDRAHKHGGKDCEPRSWGTRVLERAHTTNAVERFRFGLALRDDHLDRIARHDGNVALHVRQDVLIIDADNTAAVELFAREDNPQEHRTSASGERKAHVVWRLPVGISMKSSTKLKIPVGGEVAEFDIRGMTKTVIVAAPSHHRDGNDYQWTVPLPEEVDDVPYCPPHVMELLRQAGAKITEDEDGFAEVREPEAAPAAGHDQLLRVVNRWAPRLRSLEDLRRIGDRAVDRIYAGRADRAAEIRESGGELDRIVESAWDMFGGAAPLDEEQTDKGRALAHRTHFGDIAYYVPPLKHFMRYNGTTWDEVDQVVIENDFHVLEEAIFEDAQWAEGNQRDALSDASRALRAAATRTRAANAMKQQYLAGVDEFDANPDLLAFPNGVLDLRARRWRPQMPEARITRCMAFPLDGDADMSLWEEFIHRVVPVEEDVLYLQRLLGMSLLGAEKEHVIPFLYGPGGTGKSTLIHAVRTCMGEYGYQGTFRSVVKGERAAGNASADLYAWRGRRFIALDEIEEGQKLGAIAKSLTGDERITVRGLYRDQIEIPITWTILGQGNKEPEADPNDPGLKRRIIEIPFEVPLERPRGARDLKWTLTQPKVQLGLTRWLVHGCWAFLAEGLGTTARIEAAKAQFWEKQDPLNEWIETACKVAPGLASRRDHLWQDFDSWQVEHLVPKERLAARVFNARLKERFGAPRRSGRGNQKWQEVEGIELLSGVPGSQVSQGYVPGSEH